MTLDEDLERFSRWMRGDPDATRLVAQVLYVCHLWDDLVDQDQPRPAEHVNDAMWMLNVDIPQNPFYRAHADFLRPVLATAILDWHTANALEREEGNGPDIAYALRCSVFSIVQAAAYCVGGYPWAREIGPEIRRYGQRESLAEYKEGLKNG